MPHRRPAFTLALLACLGALPAFAQQDFRACVAGLRGEALAAGVRPATFDRALAGVEPDPSVIEAMQFQPEFRVPIWDYLAGLVDDERVADGRARLSEWSAVLDKIESTYGVDRHTVVAVWGVESDYGRIMGSRALVRSLATVSCQGSRQKFFRGELIATLRILQAGDFTAEALVGSWAGAFGQTQFMPSTFLRLAVDFDGDGRRDIVATIPDALASTGNYLKRAGWVTGAPWGFEVRLPAGYTGPSGRRARQPMSAWAGLGVTRIDGGRVEGTAQAALLLPAGEKGPAFLVLRNFDAIFAYNAAESYALAIAHLSDRLRGQGPFTAAWPTDDPGLARAERRRVQQLLIERGFDIGAADGLIGTRTRTAIREFQAQAGMQQDGRAGRKVLRALEAGAARK